MSTQRIITIALDDSVDAETASRAAETVSRVIPGSHIVANTVTAAVSDFEWDESSPALPLDHSEAAELMSDSGHVTVLVSVDKEAFFAHLVAGETSGAYSVDDLAHDAAFSFGLTTDSTTEVVGVSGAELIVLYTTQIQNHLDAGHEG